MKMTIYVRFSAAVMFVVMTMVATRSFIDGELPYTIAYVVFAALSLATLTEPNR